MPIFLYLSSKGLEACGEARTMVSAKPELSRKQRTGLYTRRPKDDGESGAEDEVSKHKETSLKVKDKEAEA